MIGTFRVFVLLSVIFFVHGQVRPIPPPEDLCARIRCARCTRCENGRCIPDDSQEGCAPPTRGCAVMRCTECHDCVENERGEGKCVYRSGCCPRGMPQVSCFVDPCFNVETVCPAASRCISNYCGGCNKKYYDRLLNEISEDQCQAAPQPTNPCATVNCGPCRRCVARSMMCIRAPCPQYQCEVDPACDQQPRNCAVVQCVQGTTCQVVNGVATCVPQPSEEEKLRICSLPEEPGPCEAAIRRYRYDRVRSECVEFTYGGCNANKNNFVTIEECQQRCQGVPPCPMFKMPAPPEGCRYEQEINKEGCPVPKLVCDPPQNDPNRCRLPVEVGPCKGLIPRWFYRNGRCEQFNYGGCRGNENNFETEQECLNACPNVRPCPTQRPRIPAGCQVNEEPGPNGCPIWRVYCTTGACASNPCTNTCDLCVLVGNSPSNYRCERNITCENSFNPCAAMLCMQGTICKALKGEGQCVSQPRRSPPSQCLQQRDPGNCRGRIPSWYYDRQSRSCRQFNYTGCRGNTNRFRTQAACNRVCIEQRECVPPPLAPPPDGCRYDSSETDDQGCPQYRLVCENGGPVRIG